MKKYRRFIQYLILFGVLLVGGYAIASSLFETKDGPPVVGDPAPAFALQGLDGRAYELKDYRGKAVIINFWGTFCPPCVREMPAIEQQYKKWQSDSLEVLAINLSEDRMDVANFVEPLQLTFPILLDQNRMTERKYGLLSYPTTFFIDPNGKIVEIVKGELSEEVLESQITHLLESVQ